MYIVGYCRIIESEVIMKEILKSIGGIALGAIVFVAITLLTLFWLKGSLWFSEKIFPWFSLIFWITTIINILIFTPLTIVRKTRNAGLVGLFITSYVYGLLLWVWAFLIVYSTWGWLAIIIGLLIAGVGVLPIAMLIAIIHAQWGILFALIIGVVIVYGVRVLVNHVAEKSDFNSSEVYYE